MKQAPKPSDAGPPATPARAAEGDGRRVVGVLVGVSGELCGSLYPLHPGENRLGRARDCDIVLSSLKISREHALIVFEDDVFALVPLAEHNPVALNDRPCDGAELCDGDLLRLGESLLRFRTIEGA